MATNAEQELELLLREARLRGLVGPGPSDDHLEHARGFAEVIGGAPPGLSLDLGSGAGLPGLPLALIWPESHWVLLDSGRRRVAFLDAAVARLGLEDRVRVAEGRAEELARDGDLRGRLALVVARSFGPPAVTAECAAGFLASGSRLLVSEPPDPSSRWTAAGLSQLGMRKGALVTTSAGLRYQVIDQVSACPDRYPRRVGIPAKRPLF